MSRNLLTFIIVIANLIIFTSCREKSHKQLTFLEVENTNDLTDNIKGTPINIKECSEQNILNIDNLSVNPQTFIGGE